MIWQLALLLALIAGFAATIQGTPLLRGALASAFESNSAARRPTIQIVAKVPTFTQVDPTIGYDSKQQYDTYWGAACSAAVSGEVLTAWGDPHAHIGQMIDDLGDTISPIAGLLDFSGFTRVAARHQFTALIVHGMSQAQLAYVVQNLGYPLIIGVRANANSYYGYLAGGHFLVVTGADARGFQIVDSSMYYIHYLTTASLLDLWNADGRRAVIYTPQGIEVKLP